MSRVFAFLRRVALKVRPQKLAFPAEKPAPKYEALIDCLRKKNNVGP